MVYLYGNMCDCADPIKHERNYNDFVRLLHYVGGSPELHTLFPPASQRGGGELPTTITLPQPPLLGTFKNLVMLLPYPSCFDFPLRS